jgi:Tfp pilus assembly protein PilO
MSASNRMIISILVVAALAIGFWMLLLGPKREEASELSAQEGEMRVALSEAQAKAVEAAEARRRFPADYRQLVVLGQAVPAGEETASLLVELNEVARSTGVKFNSFQLSSSGEGGAAAAPAPTAPEAPAAAAPSGAVPAAATIPPTEVAAAMTPLGASIGPAGLAVMPYTLTFSGNFFQVADFIKEIDSLVDAGKGRLAVDGRLVTLDGFALNVSAGTEPQLTATFTVTTYVTPPNQGITAGATPTEPPASVSTPAASEATPTTEATPGGDAQ